MLSHDHSSLIAWRLKWFARAVFIGATIAFLIAVLTGSGAGTYAGRLGGDFPSFYGAGRIVLSGKTHELYTIEGQANSQVDLYDKSSSGMLPFAYPPFVAFLFSFFAILPYRVSFIIYSLLNFGAFVLGMASLKKFNALLRTHFQPAVAVCMFLYPVLKALCGQNTSFTFFLLAVAIRFGSEDRNLLSGLACGMLCYKPQFGFPILGLFLVSGRFKTFFSGIAMFLLQLFLNQTIYGDGWLNEWLGFVKWFSAADAVNNAYNAISLVGFAKAVFGPDNHLAINIASFLMVATIVFITWVWYRGGRRSDFASMAGLAAASMVLIPPHVMFYDFGILLIAWAIIFEKLPHKKSIAMFIVLWLFSLSQMFAQLIGFSPLFFSSVITWLLAVHLLYNSATGCQVSQEID